jgi:hypothetical protein
MGARTAHLPLSLSSSHFAFSLFIGTLFIVYLPFIIISSHQLIITLKKGPPCATEPPAGLKKRRRTNSSPFVKELKTNR